jgi:predicted ester cyclase
MSEVRNLRLAKRWFEELWSKPDLDVADEIVDPAYAPDWVQIDAKGPDQIKHEIRYFRSIFPDLKYEIVDTVSQTDRVWVRYKGSGTHQGNGWGFEATGEQVEFEGVTILFTSPEGKVVDQWGAFCLYDIFTDLGVVPPFWELSKHLGG